MKNYWIKQNFIIYVIKKQDLLSYAWSIFASKSEICSGVTRASSMRSKWRSDIPPTPKKSYLPHPILISLRVIKLIKDIIFSFGTIGYEAWKRMKCLPLVLIPLLGVNVVSDRYSNLVIICTLEDVDLDSKIGNFCSVSLQIIYL